MSRPSFGAQILVTQMPEFQKLPLNLLKKSKQYVGEPWDVYSSVKYLDEGFTDLMSICTAGFIQNGKSGFLFHLQPGNINNPREIVEKTLIDAISKLRNANDNVTAFLTGGCSKYGADDELYFVIKDVLKAENTPFSAVWGQKEWHWTDLFASAPEQKFVVSHNRERLVVKNRKDIEKIYEDVFIHKGDEFIFK